MRLLFIILFFLPLIGFAQKVKVNEYDKFIKQRRIEVEPLPVLVTKTAKVSLAYKAIGSSLYLSLSGYGWGVSTIGRNEEAIFLLANDSTITLKSTDIQTFDPAALISSYKHQYFINVADLETLSRYDIVGIRKYNIKEYDDLKVAKEHTAKIKKLSSLFIEELKKAKIIHSLKPIDLKDIANHIGDSVMIRSKIFSGRYITTSSSKPTLLNIGAAYPDQLLTAVIYEPERKLFNIAPEVHYLDKEVMLTGVVQLYNNKPQIIIRNKEQIAVLEQPAVAAASLEKEPKEIETVVQTAGPSKPELVIKEEPKKEIKGLDRNAEFPGGVKGWKEFLNKNLQVPAELEAGQKKTVVVQFIVKADGSVSDFLISESAGNACDREVLRVMKKMPKLIPAMQNGKPVSVTFMQPITFVGVEAGQL